MPTIPKARFVDFNAIKNAVALTALLEHYGLLSALKIVTNAKGEEERRGACPLCESPHAFSANTAKNCFRCFACGAQGNVLTLTALMEVVGEDEEEVAPAHIRTAALLLSERFALTHQKGGQGRGARPARGRSRRVAPHRTEAATEAVEVLQDPSADQKQDEPSVPATPEVPPDPDEGEPLLNPPLAFTALKNLDPTHPWLAEQGFGEDLCRYFGIGYCTKGLMKDRIAIPIHNGDGHLVAYVGRPLDGGEDKYPERFRRDLELFNIRWAGQWARRGAADGLVLCRDYWVVARLHKLGMDNAASLVGTETLSAPQVALIAAAVGLKGKVTILADADGPWAIDALSTLIARFFVRLVRPPDGRTLAAMSNAELADLIG